MRPYQRFKVVVELARDEHQSEHHLMIEIDLPPGAASRVALDIFRADEAQDEIEDFLRQSEEAGQRDRLCDSLAGLCSLGIAAAATSGVLRLLALWHGLATQC